MILFQYCQKYSIDQIPVNIYQKTIISYIFDILKESYNHLLAFTHEILLSATP